MGNTCCKTAVGLKAECCVNTHGTDPSAIGRRLHSQSSQTENLTEEEYRRIGTDANLFEGRYDTGEHTAIFKDKNCRLILCKPVDGFIQTKDMRIKDELESSGYSSGTKATLPESNNDGNNSDGLDRSTILSKDEYPPNLNDDGGGHFYIYSHDASHKPASSCRDYRLPYNSGLTCDENDTILSHFSYLKSELDVEYLLDYFIQEDVFTEAQEEKIRIIKYRQDRADLFLRTLLKSRKTSAYSTFLSSLCQIGLKHICDALSSGIQRPLFIPDEITSTEVEILLKRPEVLVDYIDCPEKIAEHFLIHKEFTLNDYEEILDEGSRKYRTKMLLAKVVEGHKRRRFHLFNYALLMEGYNVLEDIQRVQDETERKHADDDLIVTRLGESGSTEINVLEEDEMSFTLDFPRKRKKEKHIRRKAKRYDVKHYINEDLIHETECLISDIGKGSIIIRIKGCRKGSIKRLLNSGTKEGISKLLSTIFANPVLAKALRDISTHINVKVEINAPQKTECTETAVDPKAIIVSNSEFLIEELDAIGFIKMDIFTTREAELMWEARSVSRTDCMKEMISFLIKKPESGQRTFLNELKKRKPFIWKCIGPVESAPSFDDDVLTTCYDQFVDEMSPSLVFDKCYKKGLIGKSVIGIKYRRQFAQWIMQQILLQDYTKRNLFLQVLIATNQIPQHVHIQHKEPRITSLIPVNVTETKVIFEGLYCRTTPKQKTGMENKADVDVSDKESGYSSLSFRNRLKSTYERIEETESEIHVDENDLPRDVPF